MYCSNCGNKLDSNDKFCSKCGSKVKKQDDLYSKIKEYVIKEDKASISMLEKEFKLKREDAVKYINLLEANGVIGPANGTKPREVLKSNEKFEDKVKTKVDDIMNTPDSTDEFDKKDIKDNMFLALLSYLSFLALIPYFANNNSKFVKYHAVQGMNLLILWGIYTIINNALSLIKIREIVVNFDGIRGSKLITPVWISLPLSLVGIGLAILSVIGIIYVCEGKAKELPIIGKLRIIK